MTLATCLLVAGVQTTVVDFTVTQKGLEEQLLGGVIQKEQKSLEEQLKNVLEEVSINLLFKNENSFGIRHWKSGTFRCTEYRYCVVSKNTV